MTLHTELVQDFNSNFLRDFHQLAVAVFGSSEHADLAWRLQNMPDPTVFLLRDGTQPVAFKAGYALTRSRYYSWLGGVQPDYRRRGLAAQLMAAQHDWVCAAGYQRVDTYVKSANAAMVQTNLAAGMRVVGFFEKDGESTLIMQREFQAA